MEYLSLGYFGGVRRLPPRRSKDYTEINIKNYDKSKYKYNMNVNFVYNQCKTRKTFGDQSIDVKDKSSRLWDDSNVAQAQRCQFSVTFLLLAYFKNCKR